MTINPNIFREYDIRGIVGEDLDEPVVVLLGRAFGTYFRERGRTAVALGRDCRLSSPAFHGALLQGLVASGCDVTDIGTVPTPLLYFTVSTQKIDAGVMITGSHNPPEHNGFKVMAGEDTLYGRDIQELYEIIRNGRFAEGRGSVRLLDIRTPYIADVAAGVSIERKLRVVVDAGNGTGGAVAVPLREAGARGRAALL